MGKKKATLRQRLRKGATEKLDEMQVAVTEAARGICEGTSVDPYDLLKLGGARSAGSRTLHHDLVTALANDAEAELEAIYNNQREMFDADKAD